MSAFARQRSFWSITGWAGVFGLVMGAVGIAWLGLVEKLPQELWGQPTDHDFAGGTWWWIPLATGFGLLVGLMRRWLTTARQPDLFAEISDAHVDHKVVAPSVAVSAMSLMGGASLGPEGGLGLLGGGLGDWIAKRKKADPETRKAHTLTGMAGAFGGLFTAPLLGPLMIAEIARPGSDRPVERLIPTVVASTLGFAVLYPVIGHTFLDLYDVPGYDLEVWHMFAAVGIGAVGAVVAVVTGIAIKVAARVTGPASSHPVALATAGGLFIGLMAYLLPLTLFSGSGELEVIVDQGPALGAGLLIAVIVAKMATFAASLSTGYIGGTIFPMLFLGGTLGMAIHVIIPGIPVGLAVPAAMAAVPGAAVAIPFSLIAIVAFAVTVDAANVAPIGIAVLTSYLLVIGTGLAGQEHSSA
ncbi:MAG TPA: chloride channel protein [Thermoleophilaceae bacterium]|nr:chloride channel protein [Thermoleophilaceae bacterium]